MAFPTRAASNNADAFSQARSTASAAGIVLGTLSDVAAVALIAANLLEGDPSTAAVPAADVTNGTFGSATSDVGIYYSFPTRIGVGTAGLVQNLIRAAGAATAVAGGGSGLSLTTAITAAANADVLQGINMTTTFVPGAFTALVAAGMSINAFSVAAFTSPGDPIGLSVGVITGTGATNGYGIRIQPPTGATNNYLIAHSTPATFSVTAAGAIAAAGLLTIAGVTSSAALTVNAASQLGTAAGADQTVIGGTGYGAGVASLRMNGLTTAATNNLVGTLTNSPVTGNPTFWMPVSIAGVIKYIPCF